MTDKIKPLDELYDKLDKISLIKHCDENTIYFSIKRLHYSITKTEKNNYYYIRMHRKRAVIELAPRTQCWSKVYKIARAISLCAGIKKNSLKIKEAQDV